jgi:deoxyribodipyrimidine photo-lyase
VTDHPALVSAAADADHVVPVFVLDDAILSSSFNRPNRTGFLLESLDDLGRALATLGAPLLIRRGNWTDEVMRLARDVGADVVHMSADVSGYAQQREGALSHACLEAGIHFEAHPGTTVVPPGTIVPGTDGEHYKVFTPYYRRWLAAPRRAVVAAPGRLTSPRGLDAGRVPVLSEVVGGARSPDVMAGGVSEARRRLDAWVEAVGRYEEAQDDLAADATSRLSPYLHFGCVSPLEVVQAVDGLAGYEAFVRQLCWRDFYLQILASRPDAAWSDYRPRGDDWNRDPEALDAWKEGRTGYPVVDAGMRQLAREGFMHNRARLIVASFLTKDLYLDWREGARHFLDLLVDGDIANNNLNWQWVAGTGTDTNPHRVFNPTVQGKRFDPDGEYVRRYVPELAALRGPATHEPTSEVRLAYDYPEPIVEHRVAVDAYRARIQLASTSDV